MALTAQQEAVWTRRQSGMTQQQIADDLGISRWAVRDRLARARENMESSPGLEEAMQRMELDGGNLVFQRGWFKTKDFTLQVAPKANTAEGFLEQVVSAFEDIPEAPQITAPKWVDDALMVVYPFFDVHLGLKAHAEISGEDMDLERGVERVKTAMSRVMAGAPDAARAIIINGGDFTHQTDDMNRTRRSGHILDVDGRNMVTVTTAIEVIAHCIEMALTKHMFVEYYSVPGNHDPQNWETILIGLRERYRNHERVYIHFSMSEFSVVEHGQVGIFIHHGDKRPPKDLAMFCAAEFAETWGRTSYRLLLTGHLHHEKTEEFPGIYWMQLPALAVRDAYAAGGYKSHSKMLAISFDKESENTRNTVKI